MATEKLFNCSICGKEEDPEEWMNGKDLAKRKLCFTCNFWYEQHELDEKERGKYGYAIVNGHHYTLNPIIPGSHFMGFGGHKFIFKFQDGTIKRCSNVWHQGDITKVHPYWRELMPDNAELINEKLWQ